MKATTYLMFERRVIRHHVAEAELEFGIGRFLVMTIGLEVAELLEAEVEVNFPSDSTALLKMS